MGGGREHRVRSDGDGRRAADIDPRVDAELERLAIEQASDAAEIDQLHRGLRAWYRSHRATPAPGKRTMSGRLDQFGLPDSMAAPLEDLDRRMGARDAFDRAATGAPSPLPYRTELERMFGTPLDGVEAFVGRSAGLDELGAQAAARGDQIVFASAAPSRAVVAHEVAHVLQQRQAGAQALAASRPVGAATDAAEVEAESVAAQVATFGTVGSINIGAAPAADIHLLGEPPIASRNLTALSDEELYDEYNSVTTWMNTNSMVEFDFEPVERYLAEIEAEARRRGNAPQGHGGAPAPAGGPTPIASPAATGGACETPGPASSNPAVDAWIAQRARTSAAASMTSTYDAYMRFGNYVRPAEEASRQILNDVASGKMTAAEGRDAAMAERNRLLNEMRSKASPKGRAMSEAIKEEGKTLPELIQKYTLKLLKEDPALAARYGVDIAADEARIIASPGFQTALREVGQGPEVAQAIIKAAGRTSVTINAVAKVSKVLGPVAIAAGAGITIYEVIEAPEGQKADVAGRGISGFAGGMIGAEVGGLAAAWGASLFCGPGAPVCAIALTLVVVGAGAYAGSQLGEGAWNAATAPGGGGSGAGGGGGHEGAGGTGNDGAGGAGGSL